MTQHFHSHINVTPRNRQDPTLRRTTIARTSNSNGENENADTGRQRRRLGVCEGEAHALMLEEMLKGANVVISGDSGKIFFGRGLVDRLIDSVNANGLVERVKASISTFIRVPGLRVDMTWHERAYCSKIALSSTTSVMCTPRPPTLLY